MTEDSGVAPSRWSFPPLGSLADEGDLVAIGADLEPGTLIEAYRAGYFPMPVGRRRIGWFSPDPRGVLLPGALHVSRSLRRSLRRFRFTVDQAFDEVVMAHRQVSEMMARELRCTGLGGLAVTPTAQRIELDLSRHRA